MTVEFRLMMMKTGSDSVLSPSYSIQPARHAVMVRILRVEAARDALCRAATSTIPRQAPRKAAQSKTVKGRKVLLRLPPVQHQDALHLRPPGLRRRHLHMFKT